MMNLNRGTELELSRTDLEWAQYLGAEKEFSFYEVCKRWMDIIGALLGLVFFSWLFLIVAIWIKIEDPKGPVFFRQTRVGRYGKPFTIYKFRSMVQGAEQMLDQIRHLNEIDGHMFKIRNDPRVTRIGRILRKTSIDELPQFVNVLKGDMSLVGPRPPLPSEVEEYSSRHRRRLLVTPGCTGLWQISGRNRLSFEQMVELDLEYIRRRCIALDLKIILKTVLVLFGSKDAY
jgi:lipopolysaccharide/colanic/teichoic acid biosynthesis glycosyltransferase